LYIPILGNITAGQPIEVIENFEKNEKKRKVKFQSADSFIKELKMQ